MLRNRPMLRNTHTVVALEVPAELWEIVRAKLLAAGYDHLFLHGDNMIDMSGIGLIPTKAKKGSKVCFDTGCPNCGGTK